MKKIIRIIAMICLLTLILSLCSCGASFDRYIKDLDSNYGGGLHRTVRVYDMEGDLVAEYSGKFDIETDHTNYILWDDEQGKRHIIYFSTFNVIVDEN